MSFLLAIVGRPNVGKSTLFNRLTGTRKAIVDEVSGVTRDRHYGKCNWNGKDFGVVDAGGYIKGSEDVFEAEIRKQVEIALHEASAIVFMVDVVRGILDTDKVVANLLRKAGKKVYFVVNKVDNSERQLWATEILYFGVGDPYALSATSGAGTGELLDDI